MDDMRTTIEIPDDLHRRFKVRTAEEGTSMNRELLVMIESYVNRPQKEKKREERAASR